ncbi:hypothetical protein ABQ144_24145, partial [Xanthomonas hortorum pv. hederae]
HHASDETGDGCITPLLESAKSGGITASAGVLRTVQLVGQVGGYTVMVRVGQTEKRVGRDSCKKQLKVS